MQLYPDYKEFILNKKVDEMDNKGKRHTLQTSHIRKIWRNCLVIVLGFDIH